MSLLGKAGLGPIDTKSLAVILQGNSAVTLAVSAAAAQTAALNQGVYDVWCTVDAYVKVATIANDVTAANGYLIRVGYTVPLVVGDTDKIGAIAGSAGTLSYHRVG